MSVTCFLPCRKGSERVPKKNIKPFAGVPNGLIQIKLEQLLTSNLIDEIVVSTNDDEILEHADSLKSKKIRLHKRAEHLSSSSTSTDELVAHAFELIPDSHILWTHVTSPFITAHDYDSIISHYFTALKDGYDSLMTTSLIHGFLWNTEGPINYDKEIEKWPRTQTLPAIHEINSAVFLSHSSIYKALNDRIGNKPFLYPQDKIKSFDIDWPDDFHIGECIAASGLVNLS
ncbi:cytidylyltransferase domain-containing protein [Azotobacter chroococcum]|uniref:acylneuraminate cytidylyltransferase family protein n=1 Tax=Azotobacter chroococcum TaxID=353 RepID=UPI0010ADF759|nr:acylneuraminate cytidylyltransferase family protein [Azotobacter chroococcum]TKD44167.1 acylneuraminate cytidylyltransferase family protein [Azotobacter chroococcum]